jgi:hypothetical protein
MVATTKVSLPNDLPVSTPMKLLSRILALLSLTLIVGCASGPSSDDIHATTQPLGYTPGMAPVTQPTTPHGDGDSRVQGQVY